MVFVKVSGFSSGFSSGLDGFVRDSDFGFVKGSDLGCAGADECVACSASGTNKKQTKKEGGEAQGERHTVGLESFCHCRINIHIQ